MRHAVFNTVSMMTTTGYASADFNLWSPLATLVVFGAVMVSASAGSTGGGIKLVRHVVVAKMLSRELRTTVHPELVAPLRLNGSVVDERTLRAMIVFLFLYLGVCAISAVLLLLDSSLRGVDLTAYHALVDSAAALSNAGPGLGFAARWAPTRPSATSPSSSSPPRCTWGASRSSRYSCCSHGASGGGSATRAGVGPLSVSRAPRSPRRARPRPSRAPGPAHRSLPSAARAPGRRRTSRRARPARPTPRPTSRRAAAAQRAADTRPPSAGALVRGGPAGVLSATTSPAAAAVRSRLMPVPPSCPRHASAAGPIALRMPQATPISAAAPRPLTRVMMPSPPRCATAGPDRTIGRPQGAPAGDPPPGHPVPRCGASTEPYPVTRSAYCRDKQSVGRSTLGSTVTARC